MCIGHVHFNSHSDCDSICSDVRQVAERLQSLVNVGKRAASVCTVSLREQFDLRSSPLPSPSHFLSSHHPL